MAAQQKRKVPGSVILALVLTAVNASLSYMVTMVDGNPFLSTFLAILAFCPWVTLLSVWSGKRALVSRRMRATTLVFGIAMLMLTLVLGYNFLDLSFNAPLLIVLLMVIAGLGYLAYAARRASGSWSRSRIQFALIGLALIFVMVLGITGNHEFILSVPVWFTTALTGLALIAYTLGQWLAEYDLARQTQVAQRRNAPVAGRALLPPGQRRRRPTTQGASGSPRSRRTLRGDGDEPGEDIDELEVTD